MLEKSLLKPGRNLVDMLSRRHTFVCGCAASQWLDTRMTVSKRMKCSIPGISLFVHLCVIMWNQRIDMGTVWPGMGTAWPDTVWERVMPDPGAMETVGQREHYRCWHSASERCVTIGLALLQWLVPCLGDVYAVFVALTSPWWQGWLQLSWQQLSQTDFWHSSVTLASKLWHYQVGKNDVKTNCDRFGPLFSLLNTFCFNKHKWY